jgi:hypothetical protein
MFQNRKSCLCIKITEMTPTTVVRSLMMRLIISNNNNIRFLLYAMREMRNAYKFLVEKPEGKRPLERPRCRWEDNIRNDSPGSG